jgi:hypothetical protein
MAKNFWDIREEQELMEKLRASDPTGKWVSDFVHSDNPKFAGKSKKERIRMALGASYAAKRQNEESEIDEAAWGKDKMANLQAAHDRHSEKAIAANRAGDHEAVKVHQSKMGMIKTQMNKLRKEETELDEVSQETVGGYKSKAAEYIKKYKYSNNPPSVTQKLNKRIAGSKRADTRLNTEDVALDEAKHRVSVTVSEPDHPMVTKRKEHQQKFVRVSGDKEGAVARAQQHYKKQGYKVHGAEYVGGVNEDIEQVDELKTSTLMRYNTKAHASANKLTGQASQAMDNDDRETASKLLNKRDNREVGIDRSRAKIQKNVAKLKKEEVAQVDEARPSTPDDAYSGFGSIKPHRTLKINNVLKPEKDAVNRAERLMTKAGVRTNEAKSLYDRHQELRKKSGLPDPSYYLKMMKQKQAEIEAMRNTGSTEHLHGISHDEHPGAQKTFKSVRPVKESQPAPVHMDYYKGRKLNFAKGNRGGKSSSSRGGPSSDAGADGGGSGGGAGGGGAGGGNGV